ncbi:hypothetical protein BFP70_11605 [Thioclava sp. SK-1]|nr:hypothetical protein BFP70_11605 [Thioclava sp. SK-1]
MPGTHQTDFERRLARIDQIHKAGGAFEATGALGRAYFDSHRVKTRRSIPWRGIAALLAGMLLFKATMLAQIGGEAYAARVDLLRDGTMLEQLGAWVLHADTATRFAAEYIRPLLY